MAPILTKSEVKISSQCNSSQAVHKKMRRYISYTITLPASQELGWSLKQLLYSTINYAVFPASKKWENTSFLEFCAQSHVLRACGNERGRHSLNS